MLDINKNQLKTVYKTIINNTNKTQKHWHWNA